MKKTLKAFSLFLALATVFASLSLVGFAAENFVPGVCRHLTCEYVEVGREAPFAAFDEDAEYIVVGIDLDSEHDDGALMGFVMNADPSDVPERVEIKDGRIYGGSGDSFNGEITWDENALSQACLWTPVAHMKLALRNQMTGKYLGSLPGVRTWDSIWGADCVWFQPDNSVCMSYYTTIGDAPLYSYSLQYNPNVHQFYTADENLPSNVRLFRKVVKVY